jgi:hypothetical protein
MLMVQQEQVLASRHLFLESFQRLAVAAVVRAAAVHVVRVEMAVLVAAQQALVLALELVVREHLEKEITAR